MFSKEQNLNQSSVGSLLLGHIDQYRGWTRNLEDHAFFKEFGHMNKEQKLKSLLSPDKKIKSFYNMSQFCREENLQVSKICQVLKGKKPQYKGWTLPQKDISP
jgi:predicted ABC-class ATPase